MATAPRKHPPTMLCARVWSVAMCHCHMHTCCRVIVRARGCLCGSFISRLSLFPLSSAHTHCATHCATQCYNRVRSSLLISIRHLLRTASYSAVQSSLRHTLHHTASCGPAPAIPALHCLAMPCRACTAAMVRIRQRLMASVVTMGHTTE